VITIVAVQLTYSIACADKNDHKPDTAFGVHVLLGLLNRSLPQLITNTYLCIYYILSQTVMRWKGTRHWTFAL